MEEKPQLHHIHVQRRPFIPLEGLFLSIKFKTANLYTHKKFRSLSNLHSQKSRSMKSVKIPWYQKPILHNNKYVNVQRGAMLAALFSFVSYINIFFSNCVEYNYFLFSSFCRFSPLLRQFLIYIACQWRHLDQLIMDTISFHTNLFMLEIVMVIFFYVLNSCKQNLISSISVRNMLVMFALFSFLAGLVIFVTSIMLTIALRKVRYFAK